MKGSKRMYMLLQRGDALVVEAFSHCIDASFHPWSIDAINFMLADYVSTPALKPQVEFSCVTN